MRYFFNSVVFFFFCLNSLPVQAKASFFQKSPPITSIYIRVFKKEMRLELWQKNENEQHFHLFRKYEICGKSGDLGPKRKEGDLQIPEGFYLITAVDPHNKFGGFK